MPWTKKQNKMWQARASQGDPVAKKVVKKKDYKVVGTKKAKKGGK